MRSIQFSIIAVFLLISGLISVSAEESSTSTDYHIRKAKKFVREGREFEAVKEFREALQEDDNRPEIHGYLSIVLYELGFIDDAIEEMRSAVALSPNHAHLNMELGRLYYVKDNTGKAMEQFFSVLEINPGHANAYYYLGELFLRIKAYKMAWLSAKMARRAGHKGQDLISKLSDLSEEPKVEPWNKPGKELYMRQILVNKREKAIELLRRIKGGELFENIAAKKLTGPAAESGGYLGNLNPSDVHPDIAKELLNKEVLSQPFIVETENGYHIVQRVLPFEFSYWEELTAEYKSLENIQREEGEAENQLEEEGETETSGKKGNFLVYAGAFKSEKNAMQVAEDLRELGFPSYHYPRGAWFNVVAGRYKSYQEALEIGKKIADYGYEYHIPDKSGYTFS